MKATHVRSHARSMDGYDVEPGARIIGGDPKPGLGPGPEVLAADSLVGDQVVNLAGDSLGEIKAIMIDVRQGKIAYAVLSFGGFLGVGDKLFAIPWHALTLDADRRCFILNSDRETLRNAAGFDKDRWPASADYRWMEQVPSERVRRRHWS